jgi:hypothetical protein
VIGTSAVRLTCSGAQDTGLPTQEIAPERCEGFGAGHRVSVGLPSCLASTPLAATAATWTACSLTGRGTNPMCNSAPWRSCGRRMTARVRRRSCSMQPAYSDRLRWTPPVSRATVCLDPGAGSRSTQTRRTPGSSLRGSCSTPRTTADRRSPERRGRVGARNRLRTSEMGRGTWLGIRRGFRTPESSARDEEEPARCRAPGARLARQNLTSNVSGANSGPCDRSVIRSPRKAPFSQHCITQCVQTRIRSSRDRANSCRVVEPHGGQSRLLTRS